MPDHPISYSDDDESERPAVAHDDIMQRLIDYQRQMREAEGSEDAPEPTFGEEPSPAGLTTELVDRSPAEVEFSPVEETPAFEDTATARSAAAVEPEEVEEDAAPAPKRSIFRSNRSARSSRKDADDVPDFEDAPSIEDAPRYEEFAPSGPPALSPSVAAELEARIAGFERALHSLHSQVGELRRTFADMAVAADARLGAIEDAIAKARAERFS